MYIVNLIKRLVIRMMMLVSVASEVTIAIIFYLITGAAPVSIDVMLLSRNGSSISSNGLEYAILRT